MGTEVYDGPVHVTSGDPMAVNTYQFVQGGPEWRV